jgi:hypothetical protein
MGINVLNATVASSSPIRSIQRGAAVSAGTISISAVDMSKTVVNSFSTGSEGSVAGNGDFSGTLNPSKNDRIRGGGNQHAFLTNTAGPSYSGTVTVSGGPTDIKARSFGAYLSSSTELTVSGPCRYEILEYV